jgi:excisionase family DNA binding protein
VLEVLVEIRDRLPPRGAQGMLVSQRNAAKLLNTSPHRIAELLRDGRLRGVDAGGRFPKIPRSDVERVAQEGLVVDRRRRRRAAAPASTAAEGIRRWKP